MEASSAPAKRVRVGDVIGETFSIYRQNLGPLLGGAIVVSVVTGVLSALLETTGSAALILLANLVWFAGYALYTGFVVKLVQDLRDGRRDQTVRDLFAAAGQVILPLLVFSVLFTLGVAIGLVFFIVPGLIGLTIWSVGEAAIVVERAGPVEAFGRSGDLVRGEGWSVFATVLVVLLIVIGVVLALAVVATSIGDGAAAFYVATTAGNAVTAPVYALAVSIMYFDLGGGVASAAMAEPPVPAGPAATT